MCEQTGEDAVTPSETKHATRRAKLAPIGSLKLTRVVLLTHTHSPLDFHHTQPPSVVHSSSRHASCTLRQQSQAKPPFYTITDPGQWMEACFKFVVGAGQRVDDVPFRKVRRVSPNMRFILSYPIRSLQPSHLGPESCSPSPPYVISCLRALLILTRIFSFLLNG